MKELVLLWVWLVRSEFCGWLLCLHGVEGSVWLDCLELGSFGGGLRGVGVLGASFAWLLGMVSVAFVGGVCGNAGIDDALDANGAVAVELGDGLDVPFDGGTGSLWLGSLALPGGDVGEDRLEVWCVREEVV